MRIEKPILIGANRFRIKAAEKANSHIVYVNGNYKGNDDMGKLMNDFRSENVEDMMLEPLKETVHRYKNNPEEVAVMCAELEKWSLEERQEGRIDKVQRHGDEGQAKQR